MQTLLAYIHTGIQEKHPQNHIGGTVMDYKNWTASYHIKINQWSLICCMQHTKAFH